MVRTVACPSRWRARGEEGLLHLCVLFPFSVRARLFSPLGTETSHVDFLKGMGTWACSWGHVGVNIIWVVNWVRRNIEVCRDRSGLHYSCLQGMWLVSIGDRPTRPLQLLVSREGAWR